MKMRIDQRYAKKGLLLLAALSFFAAVLFWLWNPEPDIRPTAMQVSETLPGARLALAPQNGINNSTIVGANIFSAERKPPSRRYDPADDGLEDIPEAVPSMGSVEASPLPELFGTVVGPGGAMALMQGDSSGGPGRLYREGEKIGSYRVTKIKTNSVIVTGPSGRMEIQVQRSPTGTP